MKHPNEKRFEDFFEADRYVVFKNYLYNYLVRQRAIQQAVGALDTGILLEVGAGLSPIMTASDRVVYSELSLRALRTLKQRHGRGHYVVADATRLPFADGAFTHTVCSEVLEHIEHDTEALHELARVMTPDGRLYLTVPHRRFYFAADDRFVSHFRRYELADVDEKLAEAGLRRERVAKVLGPFEKVAMFTTVMAFSFLDTIKFHEGKRRGAIAPLTLIAPVFKWVNRALAVIAWLDALLMPFPLATVILVKADKVRRPQSREFRHSISHG